mmetsp:Transcript_89842/g.287991  ORF Transcript_89842/g.287991 Transcript_89842/m.287991 type:complete len:211 (-) Transcript_89842:2-634(-)
MAASQRSASCSHMLTSASRQRCKAPRWAGSATFRPCSSLTRVRWMRSNFAASAASQLAASAAPCRECRISSTRPAAAEAALAAVAVAGHTTPEAGVSAQPVVAGEIGLLGRVSGCGLRTCADDDDEAVAPSSPPPTTSTAGVAVGRSMSLARLPSGLHRGIDSGTAAEAHIASPPLATRSRPPAAVTAPAEMVARPARTKPCLRVPFACT